MLIPLLLPLQKMMQQLWTETNSCWLLKDDNKNNDDYDDDDGDNNDNNNEMQ